MLFSLLPLVPAAHALVKGLDPNNLPYRSEPDMGQIGWNNCSTVADPNSLCQTTVLLSLDDFCLWAPPELGRVGDEEERVVAYCMQATRGARLLPKGIVTSATLIRTPNYIQIKGTLTDQKLINIQRTGDPGGELDPHGPTGAGNPRGGIVLATDPKKKNALTQVVQWMSFMGVDNTFCYRACYNSGKRAYQNCMHIYDTMGCDFSMPDDTPAGVFQECEGDSNREAGIFTVTNADGTVSSTTWSQGESPTPAPFPPAPTSNCVRKASLTYHTYGHAASSVATSSSSSASLSKSTGKVSQAKSTGKASASSPASKSTTAPAKSTGKQGGQGGQGGNGGAWGWGGRGGGGWGGHGNGNGGKHGHPKPTPTHHHKGGNGWGEGVWDEIEKEFHKGGQRFEKQVRGEEGNEL